MLNDTAVHIIECAYAIVQLYRFSNQEVKSTDYLETKVNLSIPKKN